MSFSEAPCPAPRPPQSSKMIRNSHKSPRQAALRYVKRCEAIKSESLSSESGAGEGQRGGVGGGEIETDSLRAEMLRAQNLVKAAVALDSAGRAKEAVGFKQSGR